MAAWFRVLGAVTAVALVPVFFTATAFAEDPSPQSTLHYVEAPLDTPPSSISSTPEEVTITAGAEPTTAMPIPETSEPTPTGQMNPPSASSRTPAAPRQLAQTGGQRNIWLTGFSLLSIWVGSAVITYGRKQRRYG